MPRKITQEVFDRIVDALIKGAPMNVFLRDEKTSIEVFRRKNAKYRFTRRLDGSVALYHVDNRNKKEKLVVIFNPNDPEDNLMKNATLLLLREQRTANSAEWNELIALNDDATKKTKGHNLLWDRFFVHNRDRITNVDIVEMIRRVQREAPAVAEANAAHNQAVVPVDAQANAGAAVLRTHNNSNNVAASVRSRTTNRSVTTPVTATNRNGASLDVPPPLGIDNNYRTAFPVANTAHLLHVNNDSSTLAVGNVDPQQQRTGTSQGLLQGTNTVNSSSAGQQLVSLADLNAALGNFAQLVVQLLANAAQPQPVATVDTQANAGVLSRTNTDNDTFPAVNEAPLLASSNSNNNSSGPGVEQLAEANATQAVSVDTQGRHRSTNAGVLSRPGSNNSGSDLRAGATAANPIVLDDSDHHGENEAPSQQVDSSGHPPAYVRPAVDTARPPAVKRKDPPGLQFTKEPTPPTQP